MKPGSLSSKLTTVCIMLATIMETLDMTIANVALPHMQGSLNANQEQVTWVLTSYIVAAAIMTAPAGFLADRLGRKKLFLICIGGFTITSLFCGAAGSLPVMVFFRVLQGVFGAPLIPLSQTILLDLNPKEKHGQAMALWGMGVMLGPIIGPSLGGWLTEYWDWRWVFYINLPIGIATFFGALTFMAEEVKERKRSFDFLGFAFIALFIGALQLLLDKGENQDWFSSPQIVAFALISCICLYLFIVHILTCDEPFIDPAMFKDKNYSLSVIFIFIVGLVLLGSTAILPPFLQNLMGYPVITTGLILAPRGLGTMLSMMIVGRLTNRVDVRVLVFFGYFLIAFSLYQMSLFTLSVPISSIVLLGMVQGFGMGFIFVPLSTLAYASLPARFRSDAASLFSLIRSIGSSMGISIVVAFLSRNMQISFSEITGRIQPLGEIGKSILTMGVLPEGTGDMLLMGIAAREAATIAYLNNFRLMAWVILLSSPLILFMKAQKEGAAQEKSLKSTST